MAYGNANIFIQDGGLGAAPVSTLQTPVIVGTSSLGTSFQLLQTASIATLLATFGYGEAVELAAFIIGITKAPVWFLKIPANGTAPTQGLVSAFATGTSIVTVTGTPIDGAQVVLSVANGGTIGTASCTIQISLDNGRTYGPTVALGVATTYKIPTINGVDPVGWTLNFAAGSLVSGETCSVILSGPKWAVADVETALTQLSNAPQSVGFGLVFVPGETNAPFGTSGAQESAAVGIDASMVSMANGFRFARLIGQADGIFSKTMAISTIVFSTGTYTVTTATPHGLHTGQVVTIAGVTGAANPNLTVSITATSATVFTYPGSGSSTYSGGTISQTEAGWMSQLQTEWAAFSTLRTCWAAGDVNVTSQVGGPGPVGGRLARRNDIFAFAMRATAVQPSRDLAAVEDGALTGCSFPGPSSGDLNVYHDERVNPGLDAAGFSTLWTFPDLPGIYVKNCRIMSPPGSDYTFLQYGRVMDAFGIAVRAFFLKRLSSNVRLNPSTGFILAQDASGMQADATTFCTVAVVNPGWASAIQIIISLTDALSATKTLTVTGKCIPLGYLKDIEATLSFAAQLFTGGVSPASGST